MTFPQNKLRCSSAEVDVSDFGLGLFGGPSTEILWDTSAFRSHSVRGSRDDTKGSHRISEFGEIIFVK